MVATIFTRRRRRIASATRAVSSVRIQLESGFPRLYQQATAVAVAGLPDCRDFDASFVLGSADHKEDSMPYADGFVLAVPKANIEAYKEMARLAGSIWMEYGALSY